MPVPVYTGQVTAQTDPNKTALTVVGRAGQSVNIFEVDLTAGGNKALSVSSGGALVFGSGTTGAGNTAVEIFNDSGASNGFAFNVPAASTNGYVFAAGGTSVAQITKGGAIIAGPGTAPAVSAGDVAASRTTSTGILKFGGTVSLGAIDWNIITPNQISLTNISAGFAPVTGGVYTTSSDAALKTNIKPIEAATSTVLALKPSAYTMLDTGSGSMGFIAQDVQQILPHLVSASADGTLGIAYHGIIPVLAAAFQELHADFTAYVAAHP